MYKNDILKKEILILTHGFTVFPSWWEEGGRAEELT